MDNKLPVVRSSGSSSSSSSRQDPMARVERSMPSSSQTSTEDATSGCRAEDASSTSSGNQGIINQHRARNSTTNRISSTNEDCEADDEDELLLLKIVEARMEHWANATSTATSSSSASTPVSAVTTVSPQIGYAAYQEQQKERKTVAKDHPLLQREEGQQQQDDTQQKQIIQDVVVQASVTASLRERPGAYAIPGIGVGVPVDNDDQDSIEQQDHTDHSNAPPSVQSLPSYVDIILDTSCRSSQRLNSLQTQQQVENESDSAHSSSRSGYTSNTSVAIDIHDPSIALVTGVRYP